MRIGLFSIAFLTTLVFFILKLTAVIAWSWWFIFLPLLIWLGLVVLIFVFVGIIAALAIKYGS